MLHECTSLREAQCVSAAIRTNHNKMEKYVRRSRSSTPLQRRAEKKGFLAKTMERCWSLGVTVSGYKEGLPAYTHGEEHGNAASEAGQHRKEQEGSEIRF